MANITIKPKSLSEIQIIAKEALKKVNMTTKSQVVAVFDVSGSMDNLYRSGIMEGLVTRVLGLGLELDDDGKIPVYALDDGVRRLEDLTKNNLSGYTKGLHRLVGGSTNYAPTIEKITKDATGDDPMLVLCFTDGDNFDHTEAEEAIAKASKLPIFFQWYGIYEGIGYAYKPSFSFLERLNDLAEKRSDLMIDNCGFSPLGLGYNEKAMNSDNEDSALYEDMLKEYKDFPQKAMQKGVKWSNKNSLSFNGIADTVAGFWDRVFGN